MGMQYVRRVRVLVSFLLHLHRVLKHRYSLLRHNCNHFTDTALQFLTGKTLPSRILNQASEFLATPLGQQIGPMIEAFSGNMSDRVPGTFRTVVTPPAPPTTTTTTVPAPKPKNPLVSNLKSLHNLISKRKGMLLSKGTLSFTSLQHCYSHLTRTTQVRHTLKP